MTTDNRLVRMHMQLRVTNSDERIIEGYASTPRKGRTDELVIEPEAWRAGMTDFMRSPVLLYMHGRDQTVGRNPIGQVLEWEIRSAGLWVRAQIAKGVDYIESRVWPLVEQGVLRAFSVGAPLAGMKREGNVIKRIDLAELSVVDVPEDAEAVFSLARALAFGTDMAPAEVVDLVQELQAAGETVLSSAARAAIRQACDRLMQMVWMANEAEMAATVEQAKEIAGQVLKEVAGMEREELQKMVAEAVGAGLKELPAIVRSITAEDRQAEEARRTKEAEDKAAFDAKVKAEVERQLQDGKFTRKSVWDMADANGGGPKATIQVISKYDNLDAGELAFLREVLRTRGKAPEDESVLKRAMLMKAFDGMERGQLRRDALGNLGSLLRSNEVMQADLSGYGDQWVPTLMSTELWRKVRLENRIVSLLPQVEMPSDPYTLPYEGADPTVYYVTGTADQSTLSLTAAPTPDSQVGTGNTSITAKKLSALVLFNAELVEDSIIPVISQLRAQMARALADAGDHVVLNGDTTTDETNINEKTASGTATANSKWLAFDGLRHLPLITVSTLSRDGGTLAATDFTANRALMGKYGINVAQLAHILDMGSYYKALDVSELMTVDKYGANATILTGEVGKIGGVPIIVSAEMPLTGTDGKIDGDTADNNVKGTLLTVNRQGWVIGWRRQITLEQERVPFVDAFYLVGSMRMGMTRWAGSDNQVAALSFNITV